MAYINGQKILFSPRIQITGNGSGIDAILSVASLPTENISTNHFYRTSDGVYWYDGESWREVADTAELEELRQNSVGAITGIDTYFNDEMSNLRFTNKGITWNGEFLIESAESDMAIGTITHKMPLVAGENMTFEMGKYEGTPFVKVNAETPSWAGLQNRPFGENCTVRETISEDNFKNGHRVTFNGGGDYWVAFQVSEDAYTRDQLLNGEVTCSTHNFTIDATHIVEDTEDGLKVHFSPNASDDYYIWIARTTNYQPEGFDAPFPAVGVYFSSRTDDYETIYVRQLDLEYIGFKKLDNEALDLPKNEDFKALQQKVEEGLVELTIPITYAELKALRDESKLIPGCFYRITDYRCTSVQENTRAMDNRFDIIVRALSSNTLSETASADHHEGDTYFADCNLSAWELKYCLDNDTTRFAWAGGTQYITNLESMKSNGEWLSRQPYADEVEYGAPEAQNEYKYAWGTQADVDDTDWTNFIYSKTPTIASGDTVFNMADYEYQIAEVTTVGGTGVIYYMKDEFNNECPYDFKNIQFIRKLDDEGNLDLENGYDTWCYTFGGSQCDRSIPHEDYREFINNSIGYNYLGCDENFLLPDNVFLGTNECISRNNKLGHFCDKNTFGITAHNNTLGDACIGNTFGDECQHNSLGQVCSSNTLGDYCSGNTFANSCYGNTLSSNSTQNVLAASCVFITLGESCYNNTLVGCNSLTIEDVTGNQLYSNNELVGGGKLYEHTVYLSLIREEPCAWADIYLSFLSTSNEPQITDLQSLVNKPYTLVNTTANAICVDPEGNDSDELTYFIRDCDIVVYNPSRGDLAVAVGYSNGFSFDSYEAVAFYMSGSFMDTEYSIIEETIVEV